MFSRFPGLSMFSGHNARNFPPYNHGRSNPNPNNPENENNEYCNQAHFSANRNEPSNHSKRHCGLNCHDGGEEATGEIDNSWAVTCKISSLYYERNMTDITLVIAGKEYPAHRLILCASSDVFQVMLMSGNWSEAQSTRVDLLESLECSEHFEEFLKYLYTGKVVFELENVLHLLTLADKYNVKDLVDLCLEYMIKHIPAAANRFKLIQWYQHLTLGGHEIVAEACKNFIKWNFEFVAKADDFGELDLELLINILIEDDLVVFDEYSLFQCVDGWISSQSKKFTCDDPFLEDKMCHIVQDSMACIRFPMMSPRQLADLIINSLTQRYKEFFMDKMAIGMAYHSDLIDKLKDLTEHHPHRNKLFTPRHYCTDKWSVCLSVDNFSAMTHYQAKTLVFSTPLSFSEKYADKQMEWVVDLFPKGVWFNKFYLIVWQGTLECPEQVMKTVRLAVSCKNSDEESGQNLIRVQIGILIAGVENDVEHVRHVIKKNYIFSGRDKILNFDDILPYDELVKSCCSSHPYNNLNASGSGINHTNTNGYTGRSCSFNYMTQSHSADTNTNQSYENEDLPFSPCSKNTCFLLCQDSLKIRIVITPMCEIKT